MLRFRNSLSFGFPPSEIASLSIDLAVEAANEAPPSPSTVTKIRITQAFMGVLGVHGTLPHHYTEDVAAYEHARQDGSVRAFFDLLSDRPVSLFFEAWSKYRPEHALDVHGEDRFRPMLLSLGARPVIAAHLENDRSSLPSDVMAFYVGLLRQRPMSAATLRCILVTTSISHSPSSNSLAAGTRSPTTGNAKWAAQCDARLQRGDRRAHVAARPARHAAHRPLGKADFQRFLPGTDGARALEAMLALVGIAGLQYLVHVMLKAEDVTPLDLVGGVKPGKRIGWDARLGVASNPQPADVRYLLLPHSPYCKTFYFRQFENKCFLYIQGFWTRHWAGDDEQSSV